MLERFTKAARDVVERTQQIAIESRASQVRPEHLFAALLWDDGCLAVRVLNDQGATSERLRTELDRRRSRYVDGLDDADAEALKSIGIDLEEVVSRMNDDDLEPPRRKRSRGTSGSPVPRRRCSSSRSGRQSRCGTTTSAPSTSCSGWSARATSSSATRSSPPASIPTTLRAAVAEAVRKAG